MDSIYIKDEDLVQTLNETKRYIIGLKEPTEHELKLLDVIDYFVTYGSLSDKQRSWIARYSYVTVKVFKKRTIGVRSKAYKELEISKEIWRARALDMKEKNRVARAKFDFETMAMI